MQGDLPQPHRDSKLGDLAQRQRRLLFRTGFRLIDSVFGRNEGGALSFCSRLGWRTVSFEWGLILILVLTFCAGFLDLGTDRILPGNEAQCYQSLDWVLVNSLLVQGQFPLWNPYLYTGIPLVADPFLMIYNPLNTLPVLVLGVMDGFKVGLALSFVAAGIGMWWLGAVMGVSGPARLWMALMYAFTGQAAAKFFQGQYGLVLGFPWIPWTMASLMAALQTKRRLHLAMAAISLALLVFSGNTYYAYYMLFAIALYLPFSLFDLRRTGPFLIVRLDRAVVLVAIGVLAGGLIAIQALPSFEFWPLIRKATNPEMTESHTVQQVILDFISKDPWRPDALRPWLRPEEYYAYAGIWPFLLLPLLPVALRRKEKRAALFFGLLLLFVVLWIDVRNMPWREIYSRNSWFNQFHYPTRMLIVGAMALIALAGIAVDFLWRAVAERGRFGKDSAVQPSHRLRWAVGMGALVAFLAGSVADVYTTNAQHLRTREPYQAVQEVMRWLREYDPSEYFVSHPADWHVAALSNRLRYYDPFYGFNLDIRRRADAINRRPVEARPRYRIVTNDRPPSEPGATLIRQFPARSVYRLPDSLPFAFAVKNEKLLDPAGGREMRAGDVSSLAAFVPGPNTIEIIAEGEAESTLVVLTTQYPGWEVTVDGRKQELRNVGGYLAADLRPGIHKYVFNFGSAAFSLGLILTILSTLAVLALVLSELHAGRAVLRTTLGALRSPPRLWSRVTGGGRELAAGPSGGLQPSSLPAAAPDQLNRAIPSSISRLGRLAGIISLEWGLFAFGLLVYAATRLWALDQYPIYFFADEAWFGLTAEDLLSRGLRNAQGELFPIYFAEGGRWTPALAVYPHVLTTALVGKSILAVRATSVVISLLGAVATALILRLIFRARFWWLSVLFMAAMPVWFLHSRTAFETVTMVSFYAWFLLCYLLYRTRSPRYLFAALLFAGMAFYSYSNGQATVAAAVLMLFLSDFRYHARHWRTLLVSLLVAAAIAAPFVAFQVNHASGLQDTLRNVNSPIAKSIPLEEKVTFYAQTYLTGVSPQYWFFANNRDLVRHRMAGTGHVPTEVLPLFLIGLGLCLWRIRSSPYRAVLLAAAAAPAGAALLEIGAPRVLAFVVPATIVLTLGWDWLLARLAARVPYGILALASCAVLSVASLSLLNRALTEGPLWFRDYGLYGMQYGARQLFQEAIPEILARDAGARVMVSPTWANATDRFPRFFLNREQLARVQVQNIDYFVSAKRDLNPSTVLVMTPSEYERARSSQLFKDVRVDRVMPFPDGSPGFHFVRLAYVDDIDARMAADREMRRQLVEGQVQIGGRAVGVRHSRLDGGQLRDMFDGNRHSLARGAEANPFVLELHFPQPQPVNRLEIDVNTMDVTLTASLYADETSQPVTRSTTMRNVTVEPHVVVDFEGSPLASRVRIEIRNLLAGEHANVHIYEVALR